MHPWVQAALFTTAGLWLAATALSIIALRSTWAGGRTDRAGRLLLLMGVLVLTALVAWLWQTLDRPPMRTLGETRLWYALLLPAIGLLVEWRLRTRALRLPMLGMGLVFVGINLGNPELLDRTLMPALQSPWFIPHVVVYMFSYAALGLAAGVALWMLMQRRWQRLEPTGADLRLPALLVHLGFPFLTLGLAFGAIWGKEAWGHYWSWDPKETWALISWIAYLGIIHAMHDRGCTPRRGLWLIALVFLTVLACWFLVNYLPAAKASVHTYA